MERHKAIIALALKYRHEDETKEQVENYVREYGDRFYLYIKNDKLLGYCDYYCIERTLYIYDMICVGNLWQMWRYCKGFMEEHNINTIVFNRVKYNGKKRIYHRRINYGR